jgi:phosphorylase kinase alpha/beta subunit
MLDLLAQLKSGHCDGVKVRTGRLQNLIASSCLEHLDFLNMVDPTSLDIQTFEQLQHASIGYQSLTDIPKAIMFSENRMDFTEFKPKPTPEIVDALKSTDNLIGQAQLLGYLLDREGPNFMIDKASVKERLTLVDRQAGTLRYWTVVRYCSTLLRKMVHSVSPSITSILVNGKQLTIGETNDEIVLDSPLTPGELHQVLYKHIAPYDIFLPPLQQEVLLYAGKLISTNPEFFAGILKFRVGWVLKAMVYYKEFYKPHSEPLEAISPSEIRNYLYGVLTIRTKKESEKLVDAYIIRKLEGALGRVPPDFYQRVWQILGAVSGGITLCGHHLPREPTLSEMTMSEHGFALRVEDMIKDISCPEYRHLIIEVSRKHYLSFGNMKIPFYEMSETNKKPPKGTHFDF